MKPFTGRVARLNYFLTGLILGVILGLIVLIANPFTLTLLFASGGLQSLFITLVAGVVGLVLIIPALSLTVRRMHDIGLSGWWYLLVIVISGLFHFFGPIFNIFLIVMPGTSGPNKYGNEPDTSVHIWATLLAKSSDAVL